jgi:hypothetical protein
MEDPEYFESEFTCTIIWNPFRMELDDLAQFTSLLFELHNEVAVPYLTPGRRRGWLERNTPQSPVVVGISMASPFVTQFVAGSGGVLSLGMVGFILKNPDRLGEFLPRIRESWYRGNRRALEQKVRYVEAKGELDARGNAIQEFEREYLRSRDGVWPDDRPPGSR